MTPLALLLVPRLALGAAHAPHTTPAQDTLRITVLYDNTRADPRLVADWGFAALIERGARTLLLDAGADPAVFVANLDSLEIGLRRIQAVAVSHAHGDHAEGLEGLVGRGVRVPLYVLPSFASAFRDRWGSTFTVEETSTGQELIPGVFTTGEMMDPAVRIAEQSLVIPTDSGLVIVTGCAHQGIVPIVRRAKAMFDAPVYLVVGGFHLLDKNEAQIGEIVAEFRRLGVRKVGATHCSGDPAIAAFAAEYGDDFLKVGAGRVMLVAG